MQYSDLIKYIKYSEISTLSFIKDLSSTDPAKVQEAKERLLTYIHLALIDLNNIFFLKTAVEAVKTYPQVFIVESRLKSRGMLLEVYDSSGEPLRFPQIVDDEEWDIKEVNSGTYMLREPAEGEIFFVYSDVGEIPDEDREVDIPDVFIEALVLFVAQKGMSTMASNSMNTTENKQVLFQNKYKDKIKELQDLGYGKSGNILSKRVKDKGFV